MPCVRRATLCVIFCFALIPCMNYITKIFLLVSLSPDYKLLCFVHSQGQKIKKNIQHRPWVSQPQTLYCVIPENIHTSPPPHPSGNSFIHFFKCFGLAEPPTPQEISIHSVGIVWIFPGIAAYGAIP